MQAIQASSADPHSDQTGQPLNVYLPTPHNGIGQALRTAFHDVDTAANAEFERLLARIR